MTKAPGMLVIKGRTSAGRVMGVAGWRLTGVGVVTDEKRLEATMLALTRVLSLHLGSSPVEPALALHTLVTPSALSASHSEEVDLTLLLRLRGYDMTTPVMRGHLTDWLRAVGRILAGTLPFYEFAPLGSRAEVGAALKPFEPRDTGIFTRRPFNAPDGQQVYQSLMGIPNIDSIVDAALQLDVPTLLSVAVAPCDHALQIEQESLISEGGHAVGVGGAYSHHRDGGIDAEAAASEVQTDLARAWIAKRVPELMQRAFYLRMQLAAPTTLAPDLIVTTAHELGGPGSLTAGVALRNPALPLVSGADFTRPRTTHAPGKTRSEAAIALENLETIGFSSWSASPSEQGAAPESLGVLADVAEATRMFALPVDAPWLPARRPAKQLPVRVSVRDGVRLGVNTARGHPQPVLLPQASRTHHTWLVGATGTGKSTLMASMVLQDIEQGHAVICIEPHGDMLTEVLGRIPRKRWKDVILLDPADVDRPLGLNPLNEQDPDKQAHIVSSFIGLLTQLYDPYHQGIVGPRFEHNTRNTMYTVMSTPDLTLVEVLRAFQDHSWVRDALLPNVKDPLVRSYWNDQMRKTNDFHYSEILDWVISKFSHFVVDRMMRNILGQRTSSFDFRESMDSGKIVLISLAKGRLGEENANFLGLILLPMILQAALSRADTSAPLRPYTSLYVDEFQNYSSDALARMLAEARKYGVSLTLACQHLGQLTQAIRDAVIGNVASIVAFRTGASDAHALEQIFAPSPLDADALQNLPRFSAYARLLVERQQTPVFTLHTEPLALPWSEDCDREVRARSRATWGRDRATVERDIMGRMMWGKEERGQGPLERLGFPT
ncbi:MAG TPA: type IV secretion system DNA-binding domain-containing protein [Ktedonobacterales bacterium]